VSTQIEVRSVETLEALHAELRRYVVEAQEPLQAAALEIQRTLGWLAERKGYWRARVQFYSMEMEGARRAYDACRQSDARDPRTEQYRKPDCWPQYKAREEAQALLNEATTELAKVERALREVEQAAAAYVVQARRLNSILTSDTPRGITMLGRSIDRLRSFLGATVPHRWADYGDSQRASGTVLYHALDNEPHGTDVPLVDAITSPAVPTLPWTEYVFHDANSRNLLLLAHVVGDECYIRVHDLDLRPVVRRDEPSVANGSYANIRLERDVNGSVTRARLQDIMVTSSHRLAGIGSQMLEEAERFARDQHAAEIYGEAPSDISTHTWYARRGYGFRSIGGKEQVFRDVAG